MKRIFIVLFISLIVLSGCGTSDGTTHIMVAFASSDTHPQYQALQDASDELYKLTDGRYDLTIQSNGVLGDQGSTAQLVQSGAIDMAVVGNSIVESYIPDFSIISLPYMYESIDHQEAVFTSDVLDELYAQTEQYHFKIAASYTSGARSIYLDEPIYEPADLKGKKIRVQGSALNIAMMEAMGGKPVDMSMGDVYTSVSQGTIDGAENNEVSYYDQKHYEISPYYSYTEHLMQPDQVIVSTKFYDSMSTADQAAFDQVFEDSISNEFDYYKEAAQTDVDLAVEGGATFNKDVDKEAFKEAVQPVTDEYIGKSEFTKKLYDDIQSLAK